MKDFLYSQLFVTPAYPSQPFTDQTVIVTGSNTGLGKEAARHFARLDAAKVILAVRNTKAGEEAKADIESTTQCGPDTIEVWWLDLADYASVKAFAARASKELDRIDVLCENAGIMTVRKRMAEGHESTITVNVISTFLLALLMLPKLKDTARKLNRQTTLSIVTSETHLWTTFPDQQAGSIFDALNESENLSERYPVSKLLEILAVRQLAPQLRSSGVTLNLVNPGFCHSDIGRETGLLHWLLKAVLARTTEIGSRTLVAAGAVGKESHGQYMTDGLVCDEASSPFVRSEAGAEVGRRVWKELSEILEDIQPGVTKV